MGQRNIQFNNHMIDFQADQAHNHPHHEPCIVYTNVPNYSQQFHPIPERQDNAMFYATHQYNGVGPQHNLDLNVAPPPSVHFNPYLTPPTGIRDIPVVHNGSHNNISPFKRKNAEGTSSSYQYQNAAEAPGSSTVVGPPADIVQVDPVTSNFMGPEPMIESGSLRSVRNRAVGMVGPDSVLMQHNNNNNSNVIQGNYVAPLPVQLPRNPWLDMNFGANSGGDMGALAWGQPSNLPYVHPNVNEACVEAGNIGVQGYHQLATINRGAGFLHPQAHSNPPHLIRGYNANHLSQMATSSHGGIPMIRYSNASADPFQDIVDAGLAFVPPAPPTGFQVYGPHRGDIVLDPNSRHRSFAHMRVLPEDEVAMLEIPGYHVTAASGESIDQHSDMRLDIDHMSYEELLALGEQIGSVGTGLSREFIKNNLKIRTFTSMPACINLEVVPSAEQDMANFCVVCQTDYEHKESIGVLDCGHEYHKECIKKWLVVKNSCPVCKSTALRGKGKDLAIDGR